MPQRLDNERVVFSWGVYVLNKYKDKDKVYSAAQPSKIPSFKYRADPRAQQALAEISIVRQIQNLIDKANNFFLHTGRLSLQFETEDEITREERWKKEEQQRLQQQWLRREQLLQQQQHSARGDMMDVDTETDTEKDTTTYLPASK